MEADEAMVHLKNFAKGIQIDLSSFFVNAFEFKINKRMIRELERYYNMNLEPHQIFFDIETK
jgi:hypothetical protein